MNDAATSQPTMGWKPLMYWLEPRAISRYRLKIIRKNQMAWQRHALLLVGFLLAAGGIVAAILLRNDYAGDKAILVFLLGCFVMVARFVRNVFSIIGVRIMVSEGGISINDAFPPSHIPWQGKLKFTLRDITIRETRHHRLIDIVWSAGEGTRRYIVGISPRTDAEALIRILLEHGAEQHPDVNQIAPTETIGTTLIGKQEQA